jgi:hypothetical protein
MCRTLGRATVEENGSRKREITLGKISTDYVKEAESVARKHFERNGNGY